jgi:hypothetical protein
MIKSAISCYEFLYNCIIKIPTEYFTIRCSLYITLDMHVNEYQAGLQIIYFNNSIS